MKIENYLLIFWLFLLFMLTGCANSRIAIPAATDPLVWSHNLVEKNNVFYIVGSDIPFTGWEIKGSGNHLMPYFDGHIVTMPKTTTRTNAPSNVAVHQFLQREESLEAIRQWVREQGPDHDTYSFFEKHGTYDDVPVLLYGLKSMGEDPVGPYECERGHCLDALEKITGALPGNNYSDWVKWWQDKYKTEPPDWKPEKK